MWFMISQFTFIIQGRIPGSSNEHLETDALGSLEKLQTLGTMRSIRCAVSLCWFCTSRSTTMVGFPFYFTHKTQYQIRATSFTNVHEEHQMERVLTQHKHQMCAGQTEVSQHWREFVERRATTASGPTHRPAQDRWAAQTEKGNNQTNNTRSKQRENTVSLCRRQVQER